MWSGPWEELQFAGRHWSFSAVGAGCWLGSLAFGREKEVQAADLATGRHRSRLRISSQQKIPCADIDKSSCWTHSHIAFNN